MPDEEPDHDRNHGSGEEGGERAADRNGPRGGGLLRRLVGETWLDVHRSGTLAVVGFGPPAPRPPDGSGGAPAGGWYAVHARCPFRIVQDGRVYLGSDDLVPTRGGNRPQGGGPPRMQFDIGADALRSFLRRTGPRVLSVERAPEGDLRIGLEHGLRIDVLPTSSKRGESWRLLVRGGGHLAFPPED
ncbi:hypothetical protein ACFCX4_24490 [Kitasatospora sp. NPDC056327]|uniref:hypothetical protein n=1 Tax=Kitasatospora sp. NPDC056327 TaxID=3345785 RepID=UPI0035E0BCAC